ncbi:MAG TPA: hypothetical protein PKA66_05560 [Gemmatimonadales bacterium]|nr:hypothetical protein [Gemmatimonadales bacterium]
MLPVHPRLHVAPQTARRLLAVGLILLLAAFAVVLLLQPSAVGRGGR